MLIGLEASSLQGCKSGVGYYTENLLASMMTTAPDNRYVLFSNRDVRAGWRPLGSETVHDGHYFPVRAAWMQAALPVALRKVRPDVCHFTNYLAPLATDCRSVVTIYDMTVFITPRFHRFKKLVLDRTLIPRVARKADAIITVSNSARQDILRYLKVPREKVSVIMGAAAPCFSRVTDKEQLEDVRRRYGLDTPFILYVGTIEPRKNLVRLIQAFARLKRWGLPHKLVIVGQTGWHVGPIHSEVERLGLEKEVIFTGYVPFEDLPSLYSLAESMAFPSLYEGFGLPVLEAMACGAPVVTSRSSSLVEVAGDAALLVDPLSVEEIAEALYRIHMNDELRYELSKRGLKRAALFTWEASARSTLELYERVVRAKPTATRLVRSVRASLGED
jgi:glycosyltransferase involved in cell wall biosynthesis